MSIDRAAIDRVFLGDPLIRNKINLLKKPLSKKYNSRKTRKERSKRIQKLQDKLPKCVIQGDILRFSFNQPTWFKDILND